MTEDPRDQTQEATPRRSFGMSVLAAFAGLLAGALPVVIGAIVFLDPLRRKSASGQKILVTNLEAIPADGRPRRFPVIAERHDAWSSYPPQPIGSVYLRRTSPDEAPQALSSVCPHLGCSVDFRGSTDKYLCPCHNSAFNVDGSRENPESSPSPRDLDPLTVEIRNGNEVWVEYQRFQGGKSERIEE